MTCHHIKNIYFLLACTHNAKNPVCLDLESWSFVSCRCRIHQESPEQYDLFFFPFLQITIIINLDVVAISLSVTLKATHSSRECLTGVKSEE